MKNIKVAIVYDWIDSWGGVERLLLALHDAFPDAPLYTSVINQKKTKWADKIHKTASFLQEVPSIITQSRQLITPMLPIAFESFDFSAFTHVISVSSSFAKGIITHSSTKHINIMLTPSRFLWSSAYEYQARLSILNLYKTNLRNWDWIAAQRPDTIFAISKHIQERCLQYYGRRSSLLYPPFPDDHWLNIKNSLKKQIDSLSKQYNIGNKSFYLLVSRLEQYKRVDLVINFFRKKNTQTLVIVGKGSLLKSIQRVLPKNVILMSDISDTELAFLYTNAKALIMMQEEDFGYVALESIYFDTPVISYSHSGAAEIITHLETGYLLSEQSEDSLNKAVETIDQVTYNLTLKIKDSKMNIFAPFSKDIFIETLRKKIIV